MLVPDFMHEFELGVFKAFFVHLLRILAAHGGNALLGELDRRYVLQRPVYIHPNLYLFRPKIPIDPYFRPVYNSPIYCQHIGAQEARGVELPEHSNCTFFLQ